MKVESEDFHIPVPPLTAEPHSPADPVTLLEANEPKMADGEVRPHWGSWKMANADGTWRDLCRRQAIELTLTVVALCCWTIMCVIDLFGWQDGLDSDSDVASQILSLSSLAVSCIAFATRPCCVSRILQKDPDGTAGQSRQYQLLILLASQWSLLCGALIWLVYHASSQRHPQVIAGVVAVFILLILLICSFVYLLHAQRKRLTTGVVEAPKEHPDMANQISNLSEDLAFASVDPQGDWTPDRSYSSGKPAIEVPDRSDDSDDALSDNYVGHLMSHTSPKSARSSQRSNFLKVRVASADDLEDPEQFTDECEMRKQKSNEVLRTSRGRWRPLFPTFMASSWQSPTMSRTSMLSLGGEMKRGPSLRGFRFETEKEVEESLEKEIKRHTLEVNAVLQRSRSPSPSLGSVPSQQSSAKKAKSSRASSSSGLSDGSGDKRSGSGLAD